MTLRAHGQVRNLALTFLPAFALVSRERGLPPHGVSMDTLCVHRGGNPIQRPEEFSRGFVSTFRGALVSSVLVRPV